MALVSNLPAWAVEAETTDSGFSGGFSRRTVDPVKGAHNFETLKKGLVVSVLSPAVGVLELGAIVSTVEQEAILSSAALNLSVKVYKLTSNSIPENLSDLSVVWSTDMLIPYEGNRYSARLARTLQIPLTTGLYFMVFDLIDAVTLPGQATVKRLSIQESVFFTGAPAIVNNQAAFWTNVQTALTGMQSSLNDVNANLSNL